MPIGKIETFEMGEHNWETYIRRIKQFIALNAIEANLHVAMLVTHVGAKCYELMCDLCAPTPPEEKTFDELVDIVKNHLEPQRSEIAERHIFRQRQQQRGESISDYLQGLKHLAKTCEFKQTLEENLRDQFVSGLHSEEMRSRLFAEKNIDYKRAVELALALEAAERHAVAATRVSSEDGCKGDAEDRLLRYGASKARGSLGEPLAQGPCARCGRRHATAKCRYKAYTCDRCGEKGHLKVMCHKSESGHSVSKNKKNSQFFLNDSDEDNNSDFKFYNIINSGGNDPFYVKLLVNDFKIKFEIDTGSKISAVSKIFYDKYFYNSRLNKCVLILKSYTGDVIKPLGYINVIVKYGEKSSQLKLYVIEKGGPPLMGRNWITSLELNISNCFKLTSLNSSEELLVSSLRDEFSEVFADGLGTFKTKLRLQLIEGASPVFVKARTLPLALRSRVEAELVRLQRENVIEKVEQSDFGTPIVPIIKRDGSIRICGDYKITINPLLKDYHYPLPRIDELFAILGGGEHYTKLDLSHAYQQCVLDEDSRPMTAITTHVGTFVYKRVPFGIKCIPGNFQKLMEETLSGLSGTVVFLDDICITGNNKFEHLNNIKAVLNRLQQAGLRINWSKCAFFKNSVNYLGYRIDKQGLHTDETKIAAIKSAPAPRDVTQLKAFMGLVNFYSKFCKNISDILKPLYNLLKKNKQWDWNDECERAFNTIKNVMCNAPVLAHFDSKLPLVLSVDSSAYGLGAVLSHRYPDGTERPVSCASRTLNAAEVNYSQLDKEALAIVFGVRKHHHYLYGRRFILRSDHRALSYIFGKNKGLPQTAASRIQRYAVRLAGYDFNIEFVPSARNCEADALSRLPIQIEHNEQREEIIFADYLNFVQESFPISFKDVKEESKKDQILNKVIGYVMFGWPHTSVIEEEKAYFNRKDNLHLEHGCLIWGYRIIIPTTLREVILKEIHGGHPGVVKMKQIARNYVWWSGIDEDIERLCRECAACVAERAMPPAAPLHTWEWPTEPWTRLHVDFLGPFKNKYYFVLVDSHSKWIEAEMFNSITANMVITYLRKTFARFGLPKQVVSDNGPPFTSAAYGDYLQRNGIKRVLVAPYHPSSNGAAENAVRSVKRALKKAAHENVDTTTALSRFLFSYRNTEHSTTGVAPAVALVGRRLRGRLDLLRPDTTEIVRQAQHEQRERHGGRQREVSVGDTVLVRNYSKNRHNTWKRGTVLEKTGPVSFKVQTQNNEMVKRHVDQLHLDKKPKSRFSLTLLDNSKPSDSNNSSGSFEECSGEEVIDVDSSSDDSSARDSSREYRYSSPTNSFVTLRPQNIRK